MKTIVALLVVVAFISCASAPPPTPEQIAAADYGPFPENYQEIVQSHMANVLIDPASAEYVNWRGPSKGWAGDRMSGYSFGYRVCVEVNAKNRMGGYAGRKLWHFVIRDGKVAQSLGGYDYGTVGAEEALKYCSSV